MHFNNKVVVVTGASRGLGAEFCRQFAASGARIALIGIEPDLQEEICVELGSDRAKSWNANVCDHSLLAQIATDVETHFGAIDYVIANAGIAIASPVHLGNASEVQKVFDVNVIGSINTARAFAPALIRSRGRFVQIASAAALTALPLMSAYCASKSAVEAFSRSFALEMQPFGVSVSIAYLSWTKTDMVMQAQSAEALFFNLNTETLDTVQTVVQRLLRGIQRKRMHIYGQKKLSLLIGIRGVLPHVISRWVGPRNFVNEWKQSEERKNG